MRSGKHAKLPKNELAGMEDDLRRQARREGVSLEIQVADNNDGTVDISWTVSEKNTSATLSPPADAAKKPEPKSTAAPTPATPPTPSSGGTSISRPAGEPVTDNPVAESQSTGTGSTANRKPEAPDQAVAIVIEFEGFVDHVYDDGVGVATIGYGTTRYPDGRRVQFGDPKITKETGKTFLSHDLEATVNQLTSSIPHWKEMDDNQRSALISFAYNLGDHFFGADKFTTISSALQNRRWENVPKVMELYSNPNDPKVHAGLLRRRRAEGELWQGKGPFAK